MVRRVGRTIGKVGNIVTKPIRQVGRSISHIGNINDKREQAEINEAGDNSIRGIDPNQYAALQSQFGQLQDQYNKLNGQYDQLSQNNKGMTTQYDALNSQFNQLMDRYKSIVEKNSGLQTTLDDRNRMLQAEQDRVKQEQLNRDAERSKYEALNQAIGERGKFDQDTETTNAQGAGENTYGVDKTNINFTKQINPNEDIKDDDDIKRRLSRILQDRGQMR